MKFVKIALVLLVAGFFYIFIRTTDMQLVRDALLRADFRFIYLLLTTFAANWCGAVGWRYCMGSTGREVSLTLLFFVRQIGEMVGIVNPTGVVGGEATKVFLLSGRMRDTAGVTASLLISRVIMVVTQLGLFAMVAAIVWSRNPPALPGLDAVPLAGIIYTAAGLATLVLLAGFLWTRWRARNPGGNLGARWARFRSGVAEVRQEFVHFFKNDKIGLLLATFFFSLHWIFGAMEIFIILDFLGAPVSVVQAMFVDLGVIFFKAAGAFIPGQLGAEELGNKMMLGGIGLGAAQVWLTVSVLRRSRQLFWIMFGMVSYFVGFRNRRIQPVADGNSLRKS